MRYTFEQWMSVNESDIYAKYEGGVDEYMLIEDQGINHARLYEHLKQKYNNNNICVTPYSGLGY